MEAEEIRLESSLVSQVEGKYAVAKFSNPTPFARKLRSGTWVGEATGAGLVEEGGSDNPSQVKTVTTANSDSRKRKLAEILQEEGADLQWQDRSRQATLSTLGAARHLQVRRGRAWRDGSVADGD